MFLLIIYPFYLLLECVLRLLSTQFNIDAYYYIDIIILILFLIAESRVQNKISLCRIFGTKQVSQFLFDFCEFNIIGTSVFS